MTIRIGIDASNLRDGGGITHLTELLRHADPVQHGFAHVTVWGGEVSLRGLPAREWLSLVHVPELDGRLHARSLWQSMKLSRAAKAAGCDVLFVPGGAYGGTFRPYVTMLRNMLPFDYPELSRFAPGYIYFRLLALRVVQSRAFRKADGVIFLNDFARQAAERANVRPRHAAVIPHGISNRFRLAPREQKPVEAYSAAAPFRLLYTSIIDLYKHQWNVATAVLALRKEGIPVSVDLVGRQYPPALRKVQAVLDAGADPDAVRIRGTAAHDELPSVYAQADAFVFASTCENMPNIMIEAMAAGLPIASSDRSPMPEILRDGGVYFDPENPTAIAGALRTMIQDPALRQRIAARAHALSSAYSWERCARETFAFLAGVASGRTS